MRHLVIILALAASFIAGACQHDAAPAEPLDATADGSPATEAADAPDAYELALRVTLDDVPPGEFPGLHQVYRLSDDVISGAEPDGDEALAQLAAMGVKTIVSVDGKAPAADLAARHGLRYVHVPIHYSGVSGDEVMQLAKTFRELEPPFYVHCFHGKHRGPTAAAIARIVLDDAPREVALAEMRQWCGTSPKYPGLYRDVAACPIPSPAATAAYDWDFPAGKPFVGLRQSMIEICRSFDHLKAAAGRGWKADPEHPGVDVVKESDELAGHFEHTLDLPEVAEGPADMHGWAKDAAAQSRALHEALLRARRGEASALGQATELQHSLKKLCGECHTDYRNH